MAQAGSSTNRRVLRMAAFVAVPLAVYFLTRLTSLRLNLPEDGRRTAFGADWALDVPHLLEASVAVGWLAGVDEDERARWLGRVYRRGVVAFPLRAALFLVLALGVSPAFSILSSVPAFQDDLSSVGDWSAAGLAAVVVGLVFVGSLFLCQLVTGYYTLSRSGFLVYLGTLAAIAAVYGGTVGVAALAYRDGRETRKTHVHHLYIGLMLACGARFNRLHSLILLAVGVGLFAQGVGAYGFAPLAAVVGCRHVAFPPGSASQWASLAGCQLPVAFGGTALKVDVCPEDVESMRAAQALLCMVG